ncbi:hypothetical protein ACQPZF_27405 [Actinosynnema sp. CS-041913]|uniref:hypothetical protein n=1 Tax=Actinosynnema sp. CS-041913 TaxID=3239917 RepID=UPI003D9273A0
MDAAAQLEEEQVGAQKLLAEAERRSGLRVDHADVHHGIHVGAEHEPGDHPWERPALPESALRIKSK